MQPNKCTFIDWLIKKNPKQANKKTGILSELLVHVANECKAADAEDQRKQGQHAFMVPNESELAVNDDKE